MARSFAESLDELRGIVGPEPDLVSVDPGDLAEYGKDWSAKASGLVPAPTAIVFPRTTAHVSRVLRFANERAIPVVPSGGRTGLAGGAVAADGELVLSLAKMRRMDAVDELGHTVRVQAGAITEAVHAHTAASGLTWPVDFASKGSSHVGGNIATNAGGVRVIRYGLTRQWVLGLEVVLADGTVLELGGGLEKNNTGIDLRQLFIGSEGVLGIVTEATLKLAPLPGPARVMVFAVADLAGVLGLFRHVRKSGFVLSAYEFFTRACLDRVLRHRKLRDPFSVPYTHYVLVELEADYAALETFVAGVFEGGLASDGVLAQHAREASELWGLREGISESLSATGTPHKNDIALPITALEAFSRELDGVFRERYPGWEICLFGHIGDGNLHVNVMKPDAMERAAFLGETHAADDVMFDLVQKHQGSISAEHGIGLLKKDFLHYTRTPEEIALMRAMKGVLDPNGILNPGKIF
ncbi:FAD-binding oxidoreductase [soil metagenome]